MTGAAVLQAAPTYELTLLPTHGGHVTEAYAVNNNGLVVGYGYKSINGNNTQRGFSYDFQTGDFIDLQGLSSNQQTGMSIAYDVRDNGAITGVASDWQGFGYGFVRSPGTTANGGKLVQGRGTNESGWLVGSHYLTGKAATLSPSNQVLELAALNGGSWGQLEDINESGLAVGYRYDGSAQDNRGVIHNVATGSTLNVQQLPGFGDDSQLNGINDAGLAVGYVRTDYPYTDHQEQAVVWDATSTTSPVPVSLGYLADPPQGRKFNSRAQAINNDGLVVGVVSILVGQNSLDNRAFLYVDDQMMLLENLVSNLDGWVLRQAYDINDAGQIVGTAYKSQVGTRAFILDPEPVEPEEIIPEPAALMLLVSGWIVVAPWRRRRCS
jgi:probable HAF family extracellular repeat protein